MEREEECFRQLRNSGQADWNQVIDPYLRTFHFEKVFDFIKKYDYILENRTYIQKIELALKLLIGLLSLNIKDKAKEMKNGIRILFNHLAEGFKLTIIDTLSENHFIQNVETIIVKSEPINRRINKSCKFNDFRGFERSILSLDFLETRSRKAKKSESMKELTIVYDFLNIFSFIKDFWIKRENSKSILQDYYTQIEERLGRKIEIINDLETIFPISNTQKAQEKIAENEIYLLKEVFSYFFPLDEGFDFKNEIEFWKINKTTIF